MINKPVVISFILVVGLLTAGLVLDFNAQLGRVTEYFDLNAEKCLLEIAMSYIKEKYAGSNTETEGAAIRSDFDFVNGRQAYIWLFDAFEDRIRLRTVLSMAAFASVLFGIGIVLYSIMIRQFSKPLLSVLSRLTLYTREGKIEEAAVRGTKQMRDFICTINAVLAELKRKTVTEKIADSFENWQGSARVILHEVKNKLTPLHLLLDEMRHCNESASLSEMIVELHGKAESMGGSFPASGTCPACRPRASRP